MQQDARFEGFVFGFKIGPDGKAEPLPRGLHDGTDTFWVWIALDPDAPGTKAWLQTAAGLDEPVIHALLAHDGDANGSRIAVASRFESRPWWKVAPYPSTPWRKGGLIIS